MQGRFGGRFGGRGGSYRDADAFGPQALSLADSTGAWMAKGGFSRDLAPPTRGPRRALDEDDASIVVDDDEDDEIIASTSAGFARGGGRFGASASGPGSSTSAPSGARPSVPRPSGADEAIASFVVRLHLAKGGFPAAEAQELSSASCLTVLRPGSLQMLRHAVSDAEAAAFVAGDLSDGDLADLFARAHPLLLPSKEEAMRALARDLDLALDGNFDAHSGAVPSARNAAALRAELQKNKAFDLEPFMKLVQANETGAKEAEAKEADEDAAAPASGSGSSPATSSSPSPSPAALSYEPAYVAPGSVPPPISASEPGAAQTEVVPTAQEVLEAHFEALRNELGLDEETFAVLAAREALAFDAAVRPRLARAFARRDGPDAEQELLEAVEKSNVQGDALRDTLRAKAKTIARNPFWSLEAKHAAVKRLIKELQ